MNKSGSKALALINRQSEADDPTLPVILEFEWPSAAIVNAAVPRSASGIVWIIASMVTVLIAAMGLIPIDQVVSARGMVVSKAPTVRVQPLETAIVRAINVREGQHVRAGQLLGQLDPTFAAADVATLDAQVVGLEAKVARLNAEAKGKVFNYAGSDPNWRLQATLYQNRKAQFDAKLANYTHRIGELAATISRSRSDVAAYRERLGFAQNIEMMRKKLESMQAGTKYNTLLAMDSRVEMQRSLFNAEQSAEGAKRDQEALKSERDAFIQGWQADITQQLSEASEKAKDALEQLNKAKLRKKLVELHSPTDAIVKSVAKVSVGSVMQSGQQFITLVPTGSDLEVEANISGRDNGFVHVDDPAVIKFDTFPFSRYGMAEGSVRIVSPDSFTAQSETQNPTGTLPMATANEPYYRSRITIDHVDLHGTPAAFRIKPGMPVSIDIKVGKRTVLGYLLGLVMPIAQEAMREP